MLKCVKYYYKIFIPQKLKLYNMDSKEVSYFKKCTSGILRASHIGMLNWKIITNIYLGCLAIKIVINTGEKYPVKFTKTIGIYLPTSKAEVFSQMGNVLKSGREINHYHEKINCFTCVMLRNHGDITCDSWINAYKYNRIIVFFRNFWRIYDAGSIEGFWGICSDIVLLLQLKGYADHKN